MCNDDHSRINKTKDYRGDILTPSFSLKSLINDVEGLKNETAIEKLLYCERELLLRWSQDRKCFYTEKQIREFVKDFRELPGGNEHVVFAKEERVVKITCPPSYGARGSLRAYLDNLQRCNDWFNDDYRIAGVVENFVISESNNGMSLIISQPFISGQKASEDEILDYMSSLGLTPHSMYPNAFADDEYTILISDARPDNIIKQADGFLFPIDVHITEL